MIFRRRFAIKSIVGSLFLHMSGSISARCSSPLLLQRCGVTPTEKPALPTNIKFPVTMTNSYPIVRLLKNLLSAPILWLLLLFLYIRYLFSRPSNLYREQSCQNLSSRQFNHFLKSLTSKNHSKNGINTEN